MSPDITVSLLCPVVGGAWHGSSKRHSDTEETLSESTLAITIFQEHHS